MAASVEGHKNRDQVQHKRTAMLLNLPSGLDTARGLHLQWLQQVGMNTNS